MRESLSKELFPENPEAFLFQVPGQLFGEKIPKGIFIESAVLEDLLAMKEADTVSGKKD